MTRDEAKAIIAEVCDALVANRAQHLVVAEAFQILTADPVVVPDLEVFRLPTADLPAPDFPGLPESETA